MKRPGRLKVTSPRTRSEAAIQAWITRRTNQAWKKARDSERQSKRALKTWCKENHWKVLFFEGPTGAPRTGIVDAVIARITPGNADAVEIRLVQLKGGKSGLGPEELTRLKRAPSLVVTDWLYAAFNGKRLELVPDIPRGGRPTKK